MSAFVFADAAKGGGDLALLAKRTKWSTTWGYDIGLYQDVLLFARERRIRLCGLNAPYELVKASVERALWDLMFDQA